MEVMADWNNPYTTMQPEYQQRQLRVFQSLLDQGKWCIVVVNLSKDTSTEGVDRYFGLHLPKLH